MIKEGRKQSADPVQEKLREHKAKWNKTVSAFIDNLIHLKKLMNGFPSKFHMERARITEGLPQDPGTILGLLASDFNDITTEGNQIIAEQIAYSQTRKKKQQKQLNLPSVNQSPQSPDLSKQLSLPLSASFEETQMIVEASGRFSRFLSKFKGPWFGDSPEAKANRNRKDLLNAAIELDEILKKLEADTLSYSPEGIMTAKVLLDTKVDDKLRYLLKLFSISNPEEKMEDKKDDKKEDKPKPQKDFPVGTPIDQIPEDEIKEKTAKQLVKDVIKDFQANYVNFDDIDMELRKQLYDLIEEYRKVPDSVKMPHIIIDLYRKILSDLNTKRGASAASLSDLFLAKKASQDINDVANNFLSKFLARTVHKFNPFGSTSSLKLGVYDAIKDSRKQLDLIMDNLEEGFYPEQLSLSLNSLTELIIKIKEGMNILMFKTTGKWSDKQLQEALLEKAMSGEFSEYGYNLSEKEKEAFKKKINIDQLKELRRIMQDVK